MKNPRFKLVALAAAGLVALTACSAPSTAADETAVHVGQGITEGQPVKGCIPAGVREINWGQGTGDNYFYYPESQSTFDFTGRDGADAKPFQVVSKDNQPVTVPGTTAFELNTECDTLVAFHNNIGRRYQAYMVEKDGQRTYSDGWRKVLSLYIGRQLDATLDRVAKNYTWRELYSDPKIKDEMNAAVNETLATLVNQQTDGDETFFLNFQTSLLQPVPDEQLVQALKDEQSTVAAAQAAEAKAVAEANAARAAADAQVAQKQAEAQVAGLQAQIEASKISPYGSAQEYNFQKAIEKGLNPYQPTYGAGTIVDTK